MTSNSNLYRKVRALVMKTVANGCTVGEAINAANLASRIITDRKLDPARINWPAPPTGYGWDGEPGRGGKMVEQPAEPKAMKPKRKPAEPKAKGPTRKAQIIEMLRSPGGTTIDAMTARFNILPHTARACISVFGREIGGVSYDRKTKVYRTVA